MSGAAIAFVVPAYNAGATLGQTLATLQAQTCPNWEALVVDDGSADDPGAVVRAISDPRIGLVRQDNAGLAGARNTGFERTSAPVVAFLDADDLVEPTYTERMLARLDSGAFDLAACATRMVGPDAEDLEWVHGPGAQDLTPEGLAERNPVAVGAVVMRRNAPARLGLRGPLFNPSMRVLEDWDLWKRLTDAGAAWAVEPEALFSYRLRPGSLSTDLGLMWRTGLAMIARGPGGAQAQRRWTTEMLARAIAQGDRGAARGHLEWLGALQERDLGVLVGALRFAFCRAHAVGPAQARDPASAWIGRIVDVLGEAVGARVAARLTWGPDTWGAVARASAAEIGPGQALIIYGLGHNGRLVAAALEAEGVPFAVIDDNPRAVSDAPRLSIERLESRHVVLVTPDDRATILERLRASRVGRVLLPEALVQQSAEACSP